MALNRFRVRSVCPTWHLIPCRENIDALHNRGWVDLPLTVVCDIVQSCVRWGAQILVWVQQVQEHYIVGLLHQNEVAVQLQITPRTMKSQRNCKRPFGVTFRQRLIVFPTIHSDK